MEISKKFEKYDSMLRESQGELLKLYTKVKPTIDSYVGINQEIEDKKKKFYNNVL